MNKLILAFVIFACCFNASLLTAQASSDDELTAKETDAGVQFSSRWLRMTVSKERPKIAYLCWDSVGGGKVETNLLKGAGGVLASAGDGSKVRFSRDGNAVRYEISPADGKAVACEVTVSPRGFEVTGSPSLRLETAVDKTPVAPLSNPKPGASAPLPSVLHAADYGSLLVTASDSPEAHIIAQPERAKAQCNLTIVSGGKLKFEVVSADAPAFGDDPELSLWPRFALNGMQHRADIGIISNNTVSDNAIFCMQTFADNAAYIPALPEGAHAMDMVRESMDRWFAGAPGYGPAWSDRMSDVIPTQIIAAWDVIRVGGDLELLKRWLSKLEGLADEAIKQDRNGNGLPESILTGKPGTAQCPTSNWWDQVNFGHEDAYGCALSYRAFRCVADLERLAGRDEQAKKYDAFADGIRKAYLSNFLNPETGVIAGWRDADGKLHDYWFVFVNGIAIVNGLVPTDQANAIVDRMQAKFKEVGFSRFDLGLPGNLVPIRKDDYGPGTLGTPKQDDGRDSFGIFENGGASACMAYYYVQALYQLGRRDEADAILKPMMKTFGEGGFQNGVGHGGEWRHWDGRPSGYEGMLADAWLASVAWFTGHHGIILTSDGFVLAPWSPHKNQVAVNLRFMGKPVSVVTRKDAAPR